MKIRLLIAITLAPVIFSGCGETPSDFERTLAVNGVDISAGASMRYIDFAERRLPVYEGGVGSDIAKEYSRWCCGDIPEIDLKSLSTNTRLKSGIYRIRRNEKSFFVVTSPYDGAQADSLGYDIYWICEAPVKRYSMTQIGFKEMVKFDELEEAIELCDL